MECVNVKVEPEDANDRPRGDKKDLKTIDADFRVRILQLEADCDITAKLFEIGRELGNDGYDSCLWRKIFERRTRAIEQFHPNVSLVDK